METGLLIIQLFILAACIGLWALRLYQRRTSGTLLETRTQQVSPLGILDIGVVAVFWLALQMVFMAILPFAMGLGIEQLKNPMDLPADQLQEFSGWLMLSQLVATFLGMAFLLIRHQRVQWLELRTSIGDNLLVGIAATLMLIPIVMLIQMAATTYVEYKHPTIDSLIENFNGRTAMWAWISAVGIAPLIEEFFFRGVIQGWLQRCFDHDESKETWFMGGVVTANAHSDTNPTLQLLRFWAPILITSVLFAMMHLGQGPAPIPLFFLSLGIGYVFRKTGSFVPCVIIHFMLNFISMAVLTLSILYPELVPPQVEPEPAMIFVW